MSMLINESLFDEAKSAIEAVWEECEIRPELILTEADMEARIYSKLLNSQIVSLKDGKVHIHAQLRFLNQDGNLHDCPDIFLIPTEDYSVSPKGALFQRKGYTHWGSAIVLELKLFKTQDKESRFVDKVKEDINKLKRIRETHYGIVDTQSKFFGASVIFCRKKLSKEKEDDIKKEGQSAEVAIWLFQETDWL